MTATAIASGQVRTTTYDGIPLDEPISVRLREDVRLRIPTGYLAPWPLPTWRNRENVWKRIDFNFWMPERRYVEINDPSLAGFHPRERGRDLPQAGTYVVKVLELRLLRPDELEHRSPERRYQNLTRLAGLAAYSFEEEDFGLVRFWRHDWPYRLPEPFLHYRHKQGTDPQILLRCNPPYRVLRVKVCDGYVYFVGDQLSFRIFFDGEYLPRWLENVRAVRDLYLSWKRTS